MHTPPPYPWLHLEDIDWSEVPGQWVPTEDIWPSQEGLSLKAIARLLDGGEPIGGDQFGHAVFWYERIILIDGTTRWTIAYIRRDPLFPLRIVDPNRR